MGKIINVTLKVWRQKNNSDKGHFEEYKAANINTDMSFLEMLDVVNTGLTKDGIDPIAFDHDCREGICGACGMFINGRAHGPKKLITTCQLYMRSFNDGDQIILEPFRAAAFPVLKDLMVDRSALDRIISKGGFVAVNTGGTPDANAIPIPKEDQEWALDAAECIGCGACVAACKNASAMLFTSAKISHLGRLPQGKIEKGRRALSMIAQMEEEGFGACTNTEACSAECPKGISMDTIAQARREYMWGGLFDERREHKHK